MESTARLEMRIGILVIAGLITVVALILISDRFSLQDEYSVDVYLDDAGGLNVGSPVKLSGITIGSVQSIRTTDDSRGAILARISVKERFEIDQRAVLENKSSGIFGDNYLAFTPPPGATREVLPTDGSAAVVASTDFFDRATQQVQGVLDGLATVFDAQGRADMKRILAKGADLMEEGAALTAQLRRQTSELDELIANGNQLIAELRTTRGELASSLNTTLERADTTLETVNTTTATVGEDLHSLRGDAQRLLASSASLVERGNRVLERGDEDLVQSLADLRATSATLKRLLADLEAGRGMFGQMLRSDALARDLNEAALTTNQLVERIAQSPEIVVWGSSEEERDAARAQRERNKLRRAFMAGYGRRIPVAADESDASAPLDLEDAASDLPASADDDDAGDSASEP